MITVLAGGVGAARLLTGLVQVVEPSSITAIVNVADDVVLHGLSISPDLDTCTYTLAGQINPETGWGLVDESWQAMETLGRYGGADWFRLGDRDLGTHLHRTGRLAAGAPLSEVTAEITRAWGVGVRLLPATDDRVATMVTTVDHGEVSFQEYFVGLRHDVEVSSVRFDGAGGARPAPGVIDAIADADRVVIAPSNPVVSIEPILAVPGVQDALVARRPDVVAISPIIAGRALKGPAARLMNELGREASVVGVARSYSPIASTLVIDEADAASVGAVEAEGMHAVVTPTVMSDPDAAARLAAATLAT